MRPVNLIPSDERRGASRGSEQSTGYAPYILLGVLAVAVLGVFVVVSAGNQASEKQAKLDSLKQQVAQAETQAAPAAVPANAVKDIARARFDAVSATVASRFNFERRLRQLSHIVPEGVVLTALTATSEAAAANDAAGGGSSADATAAPTGPSFKMTFCSRSGGWSTVAVVLTRMRNLDGVTKVDLGQDLSAGEGGGDPAAGGASGGGGGACGEDDWTYEVTASFGGGSPATGAPPATATEQAQSAAGAADAANSAAGSDQSAGAGG